MHKSQPGQVKRFFSDTYSGMTGKGVAFFLIFGIWLLTGPDLILAADITATLDSSDGTSSFSIKDSAAVSQAAIDSDGNMTLKGGFRLDSAGAECISSETLIVDGNVYIGVTNVTDRRLLVAGPNPVVDHTPNDLLELRGLGVWSNPRMLFTEGGNIQGGISVDNQAGNKGDILFYTNSSDYPSPSVTEKMRIRYNGNVGIGTQSPAETLEVAGNVRLSGAIKYNALPDFRLVYRDDFQSGAAGWSMTNRSTLGPCTMLGGYNTFSIGSFYRDFDLTGITHTEVLVRLDYWLIDSWDGEQAYVEIGGIRAWNQFANQTDGGPDIGGGVWRDMVQAVEGRISHTGNTLRVLVGSTLNQTPDDESFGIDNVEVWVR
ncbi:MAG: hypothetical protein PHQ23_11065 [Candidatus Wallbacteria bacterium]|nr:hypothetical protein [Candidatus Wallbacteria bacterium]